MAQSLALKYRPQVFADLTEQSSIVRILTNQIETGTIKHGYLFCGGANWLIYAVVYNGFKEELLW